MRRNIFVFLLIAVFSTNSWAANSRDDAAIDAQVFAPATDASLSDGKAMVYQLEGKAFITAKGNPIERDLKVGDEIGIGDSIYTEKGASLSISFDSRKQNAVRIPADTKATFTSIEPTDIKLDDGTVFSIVNGLAKGSTWKVTTPAAVAAVRGTVFETTYHAETKEFFAATLEVADDGKTSAIEVTSLEGDGHAEIVEGKQLAFKEGEMPSQGMVENLSADKAADVQKFNQEVSAERRNDSSGSGNGPGGPGGPNGPSGPGGGSGNSAAGSGNPNSAASNYNGPHTAANLTAQQLAQQVAGMGSAGSAQTAAGGSNYYGGSTSAMAGGANYYNGSNAGANLAAQQLAQQVASMGNGPGGGNATSNYMGGAAGMPSGMGDPNAAANMAAQQLAQQVAASGGGGGWQEPGMGGTAGNMPAGSPGYVPGGGAAGGGWYDPAMAGTAAYTPPPPVYDPMIGNPANNFGGGCTAGDPNCGGSNGTCSAGQHMSASGVCY